MAKALDIDLSTGDLVRTPDLVPTSDTQVVPTANGVPRAGPDGKLDAGWVPTIGVVPRQGLLTSYWNNDALAGTPVLRRVEPRPAISTNASPAPGIVPDLFSVRWEGFLTPRYTEQYTLTLTADDVGRLFIGGQLLLTVMGGTNTVVINAVAGQRQAIRVELVEQTGFAGLSLSWSSPSQALEVIPFEAFTTTDDALTGGLAGGDLTGTYPDPVVARIRGRRIATSAPADRDALVWDAASQSWIPGPAASSLTVREVDGNPSVAQVSEIRFPNDSVAQVAPGIAQVVFPARGITVKEVDGSPAASGVTEIRVPASTLTDLGNGVVQLTLSGSGGGSPLTVKEQDGTPSVSGVTEIQMPDGSVSDLGNGAVRIDLGSGTGGESPGGKLFLWSHYL